MSRTAKDILIWFLPIVLLLISILPMPIMPYYGLLLQIVVSITAALIIYYMYGMKPKYFLLWIAAFVFIILIFNPFIRISIIMGVDIPLAVIAAIVYLANWVLVFRKRP